MDLHFKLHKDTKPKDLAHFSYASTDPYRDWYRILTIFFIVNLIGVIGSAYIFYASEQRAASTDIASPPSPDIITSRLTKATAMYEEKIKRYEENQLNEPDIVDPSR